MRRMKRYGMDGFARVTACLVTTLLVGCGEVEVGADTLYWETDGIAAEDRVVLEGISIGRVTAGFRPQTGDGTVNARIRNGFEHLWMEYAAFFTIQDPEDPRRRAAELVPDREPGALLKDGDRIQGAVRPSYRSVQALEEIQKGLEELEEALKAFSDDLARIPEREEYRRLKRAWERWIEEMKRSGREANERFEKEILPSLQKALEELKERLKNRKKEEPPEPIQV